MLICPIVAVESLNSMSCLYSYISTLKYGLHKIGGACRHGFLFMVSLALMAHLTVACGS